MNVRKVPCFECFGTGLIHQDNGFLSSDGPCPVCHGDGEYLITELQEHNDKTIEQQ